MSSYPLKIVTGSTMASIDRTAIEQRGVSSLYLMERAGLGVVQGILEDFPPQSYQSVSIICGKGNNGGDGFVIARHLAEQGLSVRLALLGKSDELKGDARASFERMDTMKLHFVECSINEDVEIFMNAAGSHLWVDAMLGTGAKGAPRGLYGIAVRLLNEKSQNEWVVSVDIPSGVDSDTGQVEGDAVLADRVYTMGLPKLGQLLPTGLSYCKSLKILDIGFPYDLLEDAESVGELLTKDIIDKWLPKRDSNTHKGKEGQLLVIAGSRGMTGAALMCAKSAVAMGTGLVYTACPKSLLPIYASGVWEMLTQPVDETEQGTFAKESFETLFANPKTYSAVVIGPGLGRHESTTELVRRVVQEVEVPVLIDGDGLNSITPETLNHRRAPWVATPHPGEMARLFDASVKEIQQDRLGFARQLAQSNQGAVILKGAKSVIAQKGHTLYINPTGTPAMASGGMGDVLAGMVGSLLAKGLPPFCAAGVGTFLHGLAAEQIVVETGAEAVYATELIDRIQQSVYCIRQKPENVF